MKEYESELSENRNVYRDFENSELSDTELSHKEC